MAYRNKEACLAEAKRLGIDASEMSWPDLQKAVSQALKREELGVLDRENTVSKVATPVMEAVKPKLTKAQRQAMAEQKMLQPYLGKTILLSPELSPERYRLLKYDEVLGDEIEVEERRFDMDENDRVYDVSGGEVDYGNVIDQYHDYTTGTYRLKKRGDRKVVAMSSVPKENAGMIFRPGIDYATLVTWKGRVGYLWKHWRYPNVRQLLIDSGYYQEYKDRFKDEPNVWYAAGKMLVCDPHLVHQVLHEIEQKAKIRNAERRAQLKELGLENEEFLW